MKLQGQYIALKSILIRETLRFLRIWLQTLLPPAITTGLYFIIFGNLIGSQISNIDGYVYIEYIVPGLILMAVITNSYANVVSSLYISKFHRYIEEVMISPVPNFIILIGYVGGGVARGVCVGIVVTLISMLFTNVVILHFWTALTFLIMTSAIFSMGGFINGILAKSWDDTSVIPTFVLTPLTYLGGIFYSISMLPEFWQNVSLVNPILYMVNAFRYSFLGQSDISIEIAFTVTALFVVFLFLVSARLLNKGVGLRT
jgi:ABC-2 type transport system permease protein